MTTDGVRRLLILASQSRSRKRMLEAAGLAFETIASTVDEPALRGRLEACNAHIAPVAIAAALAAAKAEEISRSHAEALVIGADQVLALERRIFEKPTDIRAARKQLMALRGQTHDLVSAVVLAENGHVVWRYEATAKMTVRSFSEDFLDRYLDAVGVDVCQSVGAYQLEGLGAQLFEDIEGDYFTILGLPLIALLEALRARKVIRS